MKQIIFTNDSDSIKSRTYTATVIFNRGETFSLDNYYLVYNNEIYYPIWNSFGLKHEDGTIWFASCSLNIPLKPGKHIFDIKHKQDLVKDQPIAKQYYRYDPAVLAGLNHLMIVPVFQPENEELDSSDLVNLLDVKFAKNKFPLEFGGKRVSVYSAVVNNCRFELTLEVPSNEPTIRFNIQILNDQTYTTPGELKGKWKVMFVGGWTGIYGQNAYGIENDFFTIVGEHPISTFNIPLNRLAVTQSWMFGGVIRFDSYEEVLHDIENLNIGFMTPESLREVELPEYQLPKFNPDYATKLHNESLLKFNRYKTNKNTCWDALGQSKTPPMSGFQPQFGNFPTDVRAVLETSTPQSLINLALQEMRVMSARPGWIDGLTYVDAKNKHFPDPNSTYTWMDVPHRTSLKRWGLERDIQTGEGFGWQGQDAEHYGMTPAFWLALLTGSYAFINLFKKRAVMAQCHWHTDYYFGAWADALRAEGRTGRVLMQAILLLGEEGASFKKSIEDRLNKIINELKFNNIYQVYGDLNEYRFYDREGSFPAPYGTRGSRHRPDIYCEGYPRWNNPQAVVCWQMGMLMTAFWKFHKKFGNVQAKEVVKDMVEMFVKNGFILTEQEGPVTGMKKYYAGDNPRGYQTIGWSMDGLTQWPMCLLTATPQELLAEMSTETRERYNAVKAAMLAYWPKLDETPWCAENFNN